MNLVVRKKICTQCGRELSYSRFYKNGSNRRQSCCTDCHKTNIKRTYDEKVKSVNEYKSNKGCRKCGDTRHYVLDFHHRNPNEKEFVISDKIRCNLNTMMKEIEKCDVLCSNCHREWHYLFENYLVDNYEHWISDC